MQHLPLIRRRGSVPSEKGECASTNWQVIVGESPIQGRSSEPSEEGGIKSNITTSPKSKTDGQPAQARLASRNRAFVLTPGYTSLTRPTTVTITCNQVCRNFLHIYILKKNLATACGDRYRIKNSYSLFCSTGSCVRRSRTRNFYSCFWTWHCVFAQSNDGIFQG